MIPSTKAVARNNPKYIQIVDCGKFAFALWDFPNSHTFYPIHDTEDNCVKWAMENGYALVAAQKNRLIWKLITNPMTLLHSEKSKALYDLLSWHFAESYMGTDDMMPDATEDYISNLTEEEVGDIAIATYKSGL